jgi:hypothetical protein
MNQPRVVRLIVFLGLCLTWLALPANAQDESVASGYVGVYRLVATGDEDTARRTGAVFSPQLELADMSLDGEFLAWTGLLDGAATVYTADLREDRITAHPFGPEVRRFWDLVVGGRRAFGLSSGGQQLWAVDRGGIQMILDTTSEAVGVKMGIAQVGGLATTADGGWVYFTALQGRANGDVFSLPAAAGAPILVLARKDVPCPPYYHPERCDGAWGHPTWLDVSADAGRLVGVIGGFVTINADDVVRTHDWDEVLVFSGAGKVLITSDDQLGATKNALAISPDGSTVIFNTTVYASPNDKTGEQRWVAMAADGGGAMRVLDEQSLNLVRPAMNADGSIALLDLDELILTDGSGGLDLFPHWNIRAVHLSTDANLAMSQAGDRVAFTVQYPTFRSLVVGSVNEPGAEARAPIGISDVSLSAGDAPERLVLTVATAGPVKAVVVEPQRQGRLVAEKDAPWACDGPRDDGQAPDGIAQDGRFTALCRLKADDTGGMRVAIATDAQGWVVVKDYPLFW